MVPSSKSCLSLFVSTKCGQLLSHPVEMSRTFVLRFKRFIPVLLRNELLQVLERLHRDPRLIIRPLSGLPLELLAKMDLDLIVWDLGEPKLKPFLEEVEQSADQYLAEKNEITNALALLKLHHDSAEDTKRPRTSKKKES